LDSKAAWAAALLAASQAGCSLLPEGLNSWWARLSGNGPLATPSPSPAPSEGLISDLAKSSRQNSELLHEMHQVVFIREPQSKGEFGSLVDTLNQGASLEGIYNGFTHSADYRRLEEENPGASGEALRVFTEEMAAMAAELPQPTEFDSSAKLPLPLPVAPSAESEIKPFGGQGGEAPAPAPKAFDKQAWTAKYSKLFVGASIYTLKRILGDEAQKVLTAKKEYPEKLALWYSKWVVQMTARKVDFGVTLRNSPDEAFHYRWALSVGRDRLLWEVLNRLHRVLNEANKFKQ